MIKLANLRHNEKFKWNNIIYTVFSQEGCMTECYGSGRFWAWPNWANVDKIPYNNMK